MKLKSQKVFLALSGGVDSAVSCYLLKKAGYDVHAVFMQNWDPISNQERSENLAFCQATQDYQAAQAVAQFLQVPLLKVNFVAEYWTTVFQPFLRKVQTGLIPNPDVACNKKIKFSHLLQYLHARYDFTFFATGHYARIATKNGKKTLQRALDHRKDQTYFLGEISPAIISKLLFPLGAMTKQAVRKLANQINLPNATKKESMGICFVGKRDFATFLQQYLPLRPGPIHDFLTNKQIGKHDGTYFYTIGQRKRLNLPTTTKHFVIGKNSSKNILYVVDEKHQHRLLNHQCLLTEMTWFHPPISVQPIKCFVKLRHCQTPASATFSLRAFGVELEFKTPLLALTPGQAAVIYDEQDFVIGAGTIKTVMLNSRPLWYLQ